MGFIGRLATAPADVARSRQQGYNMNHVQFVRGAVILSAVKDLACGRERALIR